MTTPASPTGALSPYRVLDLTDDRAALGPMILADLGAEALRVRPPGETPSSALSSLGSRVFDRNKRRLSLDLDAAAGKARFLRLAAAADFLFENEAPGAMAARGLGFEALAAVNPRLVYVAITPFGQDGPYRDFLASDLTLSALSGQMAVYGDADRPPVRISVPQAWLHGAAESAVGALVALQRRLLTGEPQFVDVSVQAALVLTAVNATIAAAVQGVNIERDGSNVQLGTLTAPTVFACADGYAVLFSRDLWPILVSWMAADGTAPDAWLSDTNWATFLPDFLQGKPLAHSYAELIQHARLYTAKYTRQALFARGLAEGVFIAPVNDVADVLQFEHLAARGYWRPLPLPDGRALRAPGPFVRLSDTPITDRSEAADQDADWSTAPDAVAAAHVSHSPAPRTAEALPFAGLKVADFSWVGVGPLSAKYLADHGATTVRIETANPPDVLRTAGPFKDGVFGANRSQFFGMCNTSKLSLALDLKHPAGKQLAQRLIQWADVCLESFRPGTMAALGLDYAAVRALNPGIIMVSTCLMGQTGPAAALAGYGTHAAAISGFVEITGWPDRAPAGPYAAYTDLVAPRFLAASLLAALDHRRRTGQGQYLEQSQLESALYFLAPELLEYQRSGAIAARMGNASPGAAPHGVYPCLGEDEWCAIAVESDEQWRALRTVMGEPAWAMAPALQTTAGRLAQQAAIDAGLSAWTSSQAPRVLMQRLQAARVPAGAVQRSSDLLEDPQLRQRRFFRPLLHPEMGEVPYEGHQFRIRGYDSGPRLPAPCLGEHSVEVMRDLLAMTDDEIAAVAASGALA